MKKTSLLVVLLAGVCLVSGCDFFRSLAGRPTSADIAAKKAVLEAADQRRQAEEDSLKEVQRIAAERDRLAVQAAEKAAADSVAVADSLNHVKGLVIAQGKLAAGAADTLPHRYYVIVGAFSTKENAGRYIERVSAAGYEGTPIPLRNGFTAVGVCATDGYAQAVRSLPKLRKEKFCPKEAWVMIVPKQ